MYCKIVVLSYDFPIIDSIQMPIYSMFIIDIFYMGFS